jgi:hypothetical protein
MDPGTMPITCPRLGKVAARCASSGYDQKYMHYRSPESAPIGLGSLILSLKPFCTNPYPFQHNPTSSWKD